MSRLRAAYRLTFFLCWSLVLYLAFLLCRSLAWVAPRRLQHIRVRMGNAWARGVAAIVCLRVSTHGEPPKPPFILVSNHLGYLDVITLLSSAPGVFVSRADLASWPVLGILARLAGTIFIDRSLRRDVARVNDLIYEVLDSGRGILMFPEGTSSGGSEVLPFRSSLLEPAVRTGQAVSYASLAYATPAGYEPASQSVCWWGDMTFVDHFMGLLGLPYVEATLTFGDRPILAESRHELAARLHTAVSEQHRPASTEAASWA